MAHHFVSEETKSKASEDELSMAEKARDFISSRVLDLFEFTADGSLRPEELEEKQQEARTPSSSQSFENISFGEAPGSSDSTNSVESIELQTPMSSVTSESGDSSSSSQNHDADNENTSGEYISSKDFRVSAYVMSIR